MNKVLDDKVFPAIAYVSMVLTILASSAMFLALQS
jgi:hypothetical protein